MPKTFYPEKPKKKHTDLSQMDWTSLLDASLRCGYDFRKKRQLHEEMLKRVARGYMRESYCPIRLFHH